MAFQDMAPSLYPTREYLPQKPRRAGLAHASQCHFY